MLLSFYTILITNDHSIVDRTMNIAANPIKSKKIYAKWKHLVC